MASSSTMHELTASDGLKIRYAVDDFTDPWRPPETLILIHAAMGSSRRLYKWIPTAIAPFRVVRPDMRGHGQTQIPGPDQLSLTADEGRHRAGRSSRAQALPSCRLVGRLDRRDAHSYR
jgi:pimeloyl-ACP methyl ester carboxylesterase